MTEVYLRIAFVSLVMLIFLLRFDPMRSWMMSALRRRHALFVGTLFWISFFWPAPAVSAYSLAELGVGRLLRVVLLLVAAAYLVLHVGQRRHRRVIEPALHLPIVLYVAWAAISAVYSPDPLLTIWKAFEMGVVVLFGFSLSKMYADADPYVEVLRGALFLIFVVGVFAAVGIAMEPQLALDINSVDGEYSSDRYSRWGIIPRVNPNTLAQFGAILACVGFVEVLRPTSLRRWPGYFLSLLGLFCLLAAHSRTSMVSLVLGLIVVSYVFKRGMLFPLYALIAGLVGLFSYESIMEFVLRGQSTEQFTSLTGRTHIWEIAWERFLESPIWGGGYYAGHKELDLATIFSSGFSTIDNTYLEILVDLGVVGVAFAAWYLLVILRDMVVSFPDRAVASNDFRIAWAQCAVILVAILVRSLTGPTFQIFHVNTHLLVVVACVASALAWLKRRHGTEQFATARPAGHG